MLTRFAPSPTGLLHIGNARTCLICWLLSAKSNGEMILRFDDTDLERSKSIFADKIKVNLAWLGVNWTKEVRQSDRVDLYDKFFNLLLANDIIYPCYETKEELEIRRALLLKSGKPPIYKRGENPKEDQSGAPAYRFHLKDGSISWVDGIRGAITFDCAKLSDPIVRRTDGTYTYMLPSVIDDINLGITDIVRGEDHITNTAVQIKMFEALEAKVPNFYHVSLVHAGDAKISKREGGMDLDSIIEMGFESSAIASYLVSTGMSTRLYASSMDELVSLFDVSLYSSAPARFDFDELLQVNASLMKKMSFSMVSARFAELGINLDEDFWSAVKGNISKFSEVYDWWAICRQDVTPVISDENLASLLVTSLQKEHWDSGVWERWISAVKSETKLSGAALFLPIRLAITGMASGPQLKELFYLIGQNRVISRLSGVAS